VIDLKKLRRHFPTLLPQSTDEQIKAEKEPKYAIRDTILRDTTRDLNTLVDGKLMN